VNLRRLAAIAGLILVTAACSGSATPPPPTPSPGPPLNLAQLKIKLVDQLGPLWYCDPDFYPIARADEGDLAVQRFGEVQKDQDAFAAILAKVGASAGDSFTRDQKLTIYRLWKELNAIQLEPAGSGFAFDYLSQPAQGAAEGKRTKGTIDASGTIAVASQVAAGEPMCPICLARGTRIATPAGDVSVEDVRVGLRIWSFGAAGSRIEATVIRVGSTPVPAWHEVVRLVLDDGRIVEPSPGHPLADGRPIGTIGAGDAVDGAIVLSAGLQRYDGGRTFDLLADGPTGGYYADGVPLRSTLTR